MSIPGHLIAMALEGAATFEDLINCRYFINRGGPFTAEEGYFWDFLSGFSWYLEKVGKQPLIKQRSKMQEMAPGVLVETSQDATL